MIASRQETLLLLRYYFRLLRRTRVISLLLTSISLLLALWIGLGLHETGGSPLLATSLGIGCFLALLFASVALDKATMAPAEYAKARLSGAAEDIVVLTTAKEIRDACNSFLNDIAHLERCLNPKGFDDFLAALPRRTYHPPRFQSVEATDFPRRQMKGKRRIERKLRRLRRRHRATVRALRRIYEMKVYTAVALGVPHRRVCDHIYQYSPAMHEKSTRKYLTNWSELIRISPLALDTSDAVSRDDIRSRVRALLGQNAKIVRDCGRRVLRQNQLLQHPVACSDIVNICSIHSTSGSLHEYARAISYQTRWASRQSQGKGHRQAMTALGVVLILLLRKQRAHAGFDLHRLLEELLIQFLARLPEGRWHTRCETSLKVLKDIRLNFPRSDDPDWDLAPRLFEAAQTIERLEDSLGWLDTLVWLSLQDSRRRLIQRFTAEILPRFDDLGDGNYVYFVTSGYSSTVREVLKFGLAPRAQAEEAYPGIDAEHLGRPCAARAFLLQSEVGSLPRTQRAEAQREVFDTQWMQHQLHEEEEAHGFQAVSAGDEEVLVSLLNPGDRLCVLLGAEVFDRQRVLHPRGAGRRINRLRRLAQEANVHLQIFVFAERYKRMDDLLRNASSFFRDHMDQVGILNDLPVITDEAYVRPGT